jgi:hypothetical protein
MIDRSQNPAALMRSFHYQFVPAGYSEEYESNFGVISYGESGRIFTATSTPLNVTPNTSGTIPYFDGIEVFKVGWIIVLYAGTVTSQVNMTARVTSSNSESFSFQAYEAKGSGTYSFWTIATQWENAANYIQNPVYSAKEISSRVFSPIYAEFQWPFGGETETVITSDTELYKAGYTDYSYKGRTIVTEDEYDINRPYVGVTSSYSQEITTTTTVSTWNYLVDPPVENIVIETEKTEITASHSFNEASFSKTDPGYNPGNPSVYEDGNLVAFPTPSNCVKETGSLGTIQVFKYDNYFEEYAPGLYRPTISTVVQKQFTGFKEGYPISPASFFHPG